MLTTADACAVGIRDLGPGPGAAFRWFEFDAAAEHKSWGNLPGYDPMRDSEWNLNPARGDFDRHNNTRTASRQHILQRTQPARGYLAHRLRQARHL